MIFLLIIGIIIVLIGSVRSVIELMVFGYPENLYLTTILTGIGFIYLYFKFREKKNNYEDGKMKVPDKFTFKKNDGTEVTLYRKYAKEINEGEEKR